MTKSTKPASAKGAAPRPQTAMDKMIAEAVKNAKARQKSGQTAREWRAAYAASLKSPGGTDVKLSETPFAGDTNRKKT
jgi:hypothetical protein